MHQVPRADRLSTGFPEPSYTVATEEEAPGMALTDEDLMEAYKSGNGSAFDELVRRYGDPLFGYLVRLTGDRAHAEDLFQETFLRVHSRCRTFGRGRSFRPWVYAIATNVAIDGMRAGARQAVTVPLDGGAPAPAAQDDPAGDAARREDHAMVRRAIDELPPGQRAVLVLAYYQGLTYREVAEVRGCSVGTVKTQMSRALHRLADVLPPPEGNRP